jgi:hypothetical protein
MELFKTKEELLSWACKGYDDPNCVTLEFGVWSGHTIKIIRDSFSGQVYGFDSFEGLPEKWRDGFEKGHFKTESIPLVEGVEMVVGYFQDTLEDFLKNLNKKIKVIHFDADLYSSTAYCLDLVTNHLSDNCIFIFDEYQNYPGCGEHEEKAFLEWLEKNKNFSSVRTAEVEEGVKPNGEQVAFSINKVV